MPWSGAIARPMTPWPCSPAATTKTSWSRAGSNSASEAASASNKVTVASTIELRTARSAPSSSRRAIEPRRAIARNRSRAAASNRSAGLRAGLTRRSPVDAARQRRQVGDQELLALEPDQAPGDEVLEEPVHGLTGAPDHARKIGLGVRPFEGDIGGLVRVCLPGNRHDPAREPSGQVQEMELADVTGQPA